MTPLHPELQTLFDRCRRDHHQWINGSAAGYELPADGTIMGAVGGVSAGGPETAQRQGAVAAQFRSGHGDLEFVNGAVAGDVAWLVFLERAVVVFDPAVGEERWDLRVTEVFRRAEGGWERVHRQADPLVDRRPVADIRALLRGADGDGR